MAQWYYLPINPDPWAIGPLGVGKRNGKFFPYVGRNAQLHSYQEAVKEELQSQSVEMMPEGKYELEFYFWRRLDSHASGKKHIADATNLAKATEDAIQGVLIENDKDVAHITSTIIEQSTETIPGVLFNIAMADSMTFLAPMPNELQAVRAAQKNTFDLYSGDNTWPPS